MFWLSDKTARKLTELRIIAHRPTVSDKNAGLCISLMDIIALSCRPIQLIRLNIHGLCYLVILIVTRKFYGVIPLGCLKRERQTGELCSHSQLSYMLFTDV